MIAEALEAAAIIGRVSTPEENARAVDAQRVVVAAKGLVEKARKQLKEPVLDFGRQIDATAKQLVAPLEPEEMRLAKLLGDYQQLQEAKRKAEEAARLLEEKRIEMERQNEFARLRREQQALEQKLMAEAAELSRKANEVKNAAERAKLEQLAQETKRQQELAAAQSLERMEAVQEKFDAQAQALPQVEAPVRAKGQAVSEEVVIDGIREFELMRARPDLVRKVEFDLLTLKKDLAAGTKVPGVTWHKETKSRVRTSSYREAITIGGAA
jgi:hypothetical protein